jgi:putative membrane protein
VRARRTYLAVRIDAAFTTVKSMPATVSNMAIAESVRQRTRANPRAVTAVLSLLGYALVVGAFAGLLPIPELHGDTVPVLGREKLVVNVLGDAIAVVNTVALAALLVGWWLIQRGDVRRHRAAMLSAFALILLFLALYLVKVNGAGEKRILASGPVLWAYLTMLAVHILLSAAAVPVVVHAVVLGLTHSAAELPRTVHPRVGRLGVAVWSLSLALGIVTYVLLNHVYGWEFRGAEALVGLWLARPAGE